MIDAKVCNAATSTKSTMRCYLCGQTSSEFNNLNYVNAIDTHAVKFGLSPLHLRIRLFENLLHISYKLPIKCWQARGVEAKQAVKDRKKKVQKCFREEMGLIVDVPKAGFGNTNDGNTNRRFFENVEQSAKITEIDPKLIIKFKIILEAIASGFDIDVSKFSSFAADTAKLYVELYGWYPMTPTMHKFLMHGPEIIKNALLPIGLLSEEALEARNKHFRKFREGHSRKFSRTECNRDIFNRLILISDPFLSLNVKKKPKKSKAFQPETLKLLLP